MKKQKDHRETTTMALSTTPRRFHRGRGRILVHAIVAGSKVIIQIRDLALKQTTLVRGHAMAMTQIGTPDFVHSGVRSTLEAGRPLGERMFQPTPQECTGSGSRSPLGRLETLVICASQSGIMQFIDNSISERAIYNGKLAGKVTRPLEELPAPLCVGQETGRFSREICDFSLQ